MKMSLKLSLLSAVLFCALKIQAVPSDIVLGFDCSKKSFSGHFGENTYGNNLYGIEGAFAKAKGNANLTYGPVLQSPMSWTLRIANPTVERYNFDVYEGLYGIGTKKGFEEDKIINFATYSQSDDDSLLSYFENSTDQIFKDQEYGLDFNPIPFMKHVVNHLEKQKKPKLVTALIFTSGDVEDCKRESLKDLLVQTSYLPIKWIFVVVGRDSESNEVGKIIKSTHGMGRFFDNAQVLATDRYFDFDGIGGWTKFDIDDSLKNLKLKKFEDDISNFLKKDYESKVLKLIHARELMISCRSEARSLVVY